MAPCAKFFVGRIDWRSYWTFPIKTRLVACVPLFSLIHPRIDFPTGLLVSQPMAIPMFNWKITNPNCGFPIAPGLIEDRFFSCMAVAVAGWPWPWPGGRGRVAVAVVGEVAVAMAVAGSPDGRLAGWSGGRMAGWPWPGGRMAAGLGGRVGGCGRVAVAVAGWPVGRDLWVGGGGGEERI